ncbi:16S rRNA A1518/A1519 N6-dimethyltransferase RsmA/KsgA/DIM1 with predicted DNA glycosylase/AP lyase activity [Brevibacterium sanguinis]|uniref:16S rRNA A1518/A1519 N6-dimethyltransferase RsmA/KsgA/DIM1 with predicted DNA glycosylase/AP lyase activity n=2 Tax=Brevibacterium TaxID=1696 RepID=A0A366IGD5_9MICO|nr:MULTISPECIES: 23S ribosomal RNA methyltransferase Erm [Brevibacterium]RBP62251.1 16S rRNA A1518/A1519 N6-dimethyltransferase RsmA/KsgA/DIM1 with predicted DNA glycosylase/AP lyase activity [Brevibacterium sanguinis]RBP70617.1 16S rRNA A1518/A1519 N6-dimethyltransferase RsmA/KsgA/DIM1 with predicted DNA glycosylase/AP lyase activity [Brevibacterium celere]
MRPHSAFGGRHELGQNFLRSQTTIRTIARLTRATAGPILEIGPGSGAVTARLYELGRPLTLVELDETRIDHLEHRFPHAQIRHADALTTPFDASVIVGNIPFHLTTPILHKLLRSPSWQTAILLTQWEVARKRAGVGGSTMLTAQWAPWYEFRLVERVPAHAFSPRSSVDGGLLSIGRSTPSLLASRHRSDYQQFVRTVFTGRGRGMKGILTRMDLTDRSTLQSALTDNDIRGDDLPRDLTPDQWTGLYSALRPHATGESSSQAAGSDSPETTRARATPQKTTPRKSKENTMRNSKGKTMRNDSPSTPPTMRKDSSTAPSVPATQRTPGAFGALPITGEIPAVAEKPVITGEIPIIGAEAAKALHAPLPGGDAKAKGHDKAHPGAERGFRPQHRKAQPQPRWNLPRRQG